MPTRPLELNSLYFKVGWPNSKPPSKADLSSSLPRSLTATLPAPKYFVLFLSSSCRLFLSSSRSLIPTLICCLFHLVAAIFYFYFYFFRGSWFLINYTSLSHHRSDPIYLNHQKVYRARTVGALLGNFISPLWGLLTTASQSLFSFPCNPVD